MRSGKYLMILSLAAIFCAFAAFGQAGASPAGGADFDRTAVTPRISFIGIPGGGEDQLFISSEKGLVVFNTFWSSINARKYREAIAASAGREDFIYVIDMVDRLDMFGGNAAYPGVEIVGHRAFLDKYEGRQDEVEAEVARLIEMWQRKEKVSRERLPSHEPGSEAEKNERRWMETCAQRARELEDGFSLVLPSRIYDDRLDLDLGDITLELIWFGRAGYDGMTVAKVPEEKVAIIPGFIMHSQHLAPNPQPMYAELDVPRWIEVFEEVFEGEGAVETVVCDINKVWPVERARTHLHYIRTLWNEVREAAERGESLDAVQEEMSIDGRFAFVKEMQPYIDYGDDWIRPQHRMHVKLFYLQGRTLASEVLKASADRPVAETLEKIRAMLAEGTLYIDEEYMSGIGFYLAGQSRPDDAAKVFRFVTEVFPGSKDAVRMLEELGAE